MSNKEKQKQELKLLFFDNLESNKPSYNIVEVFFSKAVNIMQFRILKPDSNPHAKYKSMKSKTQKDIIYNFEIFGRNLRKIDDKFELIFKCDNINKINGETDNIFPLLEKFTTNHVIFRGKFEMITMCIYGTTCDNNENIILMEQARADVSLAKIREKIELKKKKQTEKGTLISKEEKNLIEKYPIEKLLGEEYNEIFKEGTKKKTKKEPMLADEEETNETFKEINYINKGNKAYFNLQQILSKYGQRKGKIFESVIINSNSASEIVNKLIKDEKAIKILLNPDMKYICITCGYIPEWKNICIIIDIIEDFIVYNSSKKNNKNNGIQILNEICLSENIANIEEKFEARTHKVNYEISRNPEEKIKYNCNTTEGKEKFKGIMPIHIPDINPLYYKTKSGNFHKSFSLNKIQNINKHRETICFFVICKIILHKKGNNK